MSERITVLIARDGIDNRQETVSRRPAPSMGVAQSRWRQKWSPGPVEDRSPTGQPA